MLSPTNMHLLQIPQKKYYYDFWEVLRYFGVDRYAPEARQFIDWLTANGTVKLRNSTHLTFDESDTDPFIFGLQEEVPALVKSVMLKAMDIFGENEDESGSKVLNLLFHY